MYLFCRCFQSQAGEIWFQHHSFQAQRITPTPLRAPFCAGSPTVSLAPSEAPGTRPHCQGPTSILPSSARRQRHRQHSWREGPHLCCRLFRGLLARSSSPGPASWRAGWWVSGVLRCLLCESTASSPQMGRLDARYCCHLKLLKNLSIDNVHATQAKTRVGGKRPLNGLVVSYSLLGTGTGIHSVQRGCTAR